MLCPRCRSGHCRRSRRRAWSDYFISSIIGVRPWRCRTCELRFLAWSVAFPYLGYVHCRRCGNLDIQRISSTHVDGWFAWFGRMAQFPAYRCPPCRRRFFSVLRHRRLRAIDEDFAEREETTQTTTIGAR